MFTYKGCHVIDRKHLHGWTRTQGKPWGGGLSYYAGADPSIPILSYFSSTYTAAHFVTLLSAVCGAVIKIVIVIVVVIVIITIIYTRVDLMQPILVVPLIQHDKQYICILVQHVQGTRQNKLYTRICTFIYGCECECVEV